MAARIFIGTSGYSYDDWLGYFYPPKLPRSKMLEYYAQEFPFTEVNSSFYALPSPKMCEGLAKKTPANFVFTVKAHKSMTHERPGNVEEFAKRFLFALQPLLGAGKLGAVLLQFPYSFHNTPENRRYLAKLNALFSTVPAVVEFRHHTWTGKATWDFLRELGLGYTCVDEPALKGLVRPAVVCTAPVAYVRFHGRNAAKWWNHEQAYERYDYLYTEEELREWVPGIKSLAAEAERVFVAFNNHYRGQAVINARMLREMLG